MGGGSWATALAKLLLNNNDSILWYMRRDDRIEEFRRNHRNPAYLSDVEFNTDKIEFTSDINEVCSKADTIVLAMPSPYFKSHMNKVTVDISGKYVVSAVKGIVPDDNLIITDYISQKYNVPHERTLVIGGPCHAEEVALGRKSYLTIGCQDLFHAEQFATALSGPALTTITSSDVVGIEYAAILISNAIREMERFVDTVNPRPRQICDSVYLGDLLVTSYSRFSRNHNFGSMIGRGYSVTAARMEMEQTAEGYYGTKCIHEINNKFGVTMPILDGVFDILYRKVKPATAIKRMSETFI